MKHASLGALLISALFAGFAFAAEPTKDDAAVLREARDRAEIEALLWRYVRALDGGDSEAYAAAFTEDGTFTSGSNTVSGREALNQMMIDTVRARNERRPDGERVRPQMYHMTADSYIEFLREDRALHHSYYFGAVVATKDSPARIAGPGRAVDELVRVDGQWLIKSRTVGLQD